MLGANLGQLLAGLQSWRMLHFKAAQVEATLKLPESESAPAEGPLELSHADFGWPVLPSPEGPPSDGADGGAGHAFEVHRVLTSVDFKPEAGELVLVCGAIGAGKSSLLHSLLGQTQRLAGAASLPAGAAAFQPQEPFLLDVTIRENVLLGIPDEDCSQTDLELALSASQLIGDFRDPKSTLCALREHTPAGKQGSNLSGGQRARVALARAVYAVLRGAELAVLDDPVAQVDNEVMEAAWNAAVVQAMRGTTRIVAVNSQLLGRVALSADRVVLLEEGRITYNGTPAAAMQSPQLVEALGGDLKLSPKHTCAGNDATPATDSEARLADPEFEEMARLNEEEASGEQAALRLADLVRDCTALRKFVHGPSGSELAKPLQLSSGEWTAFRAALVRVERGWKTRALASKSISKTDAMLSLLWRTRAWILPSAVPALTANLQSYCTCWTVRQWELGQTHGVGNLGWFLFLSFQYLFFNTCQALAFIAVSCGMTTLGLSLHTDSNQTFRRLGMPYFWRLGNGAETHVRRVCNLEMERFLNFSKVPLQLMTFLIYAAPVLYKAPQLAPVLAVVAPIFPRIIKVRKWIVRHVQPCEQILGARQAILAKDLFDGVATLRSLKREAHFDLIEQEVIYSGMQLKYWVAMAGWHAELLTWVIRAAFVAGAFMAIRALKQLGGEAWIGQVLFVNAIVMCQLLASFCGDYLDSEELLENYRLLEDFLRTDCLEPSDGDDPPESWPSSGAISIKNVTFRYMPHMSAALREVSAEVQPGEKVGVVGKTGSGKSTLVSLLFRLGPIQDGGPHGSGCVRVDGVDLANLKLSALRRAVGLVPQEPAWFNCSLRSQVSGEHTDAEILAALERCGLDARQITRTTTSPEALAKVLSPSDLSVGQRQLVMVARALVRRPKILVMDESTAFLDRKSSDRLLEVIAAQCKDSTVLSIAHRLRFVLDADRIMVLSGGQVIAFDTPASLLEDKDGYFATNFSLEQLEDSG